MKKLSMSQLFYLIFRLFFETKALCFTKKMKNDKLENNNETADEVSGKANSRYLTTGYGVTGK
jgi:hypothetical protein